MCPSSTNYAFNLCVLIHFSIIDAPYVKVMELKLNISAQGLATSDMKTNKVVCMIA